MKKEITKRKSIRWALVFYDVLFTAFCAFSLTSRKQSTRVRNYEARNYENEVQTYSMSLLR